MDRRVLPRPHDGRGEHRDRGFTLRRLLAALQQFLEHDGFAAAETAQRGIDDDGIGGVTFEHGRRRRLHAVPAGRTPSDAASCSRTDQ